MDKFPVLSFYRSFSYVLGGLVIVGGLILAIVTANITDFSGRSQFNFGVFIGILIPIALLGLSVIVTAELIELFQTIEDHLDRIRRIQESLVPRTPTSTAPRPTTGGMLSKLAGFTPPSDDPLSKNRPPTGQAPTAYRPSTSSAALPNLANNAIRNFDDMLEATVKTERSFLRAGSGTQHSALTVVSQGHALKLCGRNRDSNWVQVYADEKAYQWVAASDLDIKGDISALPITSAE